MDSGYVTQVEHKEFAHRMEDEHRRQNKRLEIMEKMFEQNNRLIINVEKLADNMGSMKEELENQGDRLEALESRDGETWRKVKSNIITAVVSLLVGFLATYIGLN